jgi:hypothetical protein
MAAITRTDPPETAIANNADQGNRIPPSVARKPVNAKLTTHHPTTGHLMLKALLR